MRACEGEVGEQGGRYKCKIEKGAAFKAALTKQFVLIRDEASAAKPMSNIRFVKNRH